MNEDNTLPDNTLADGAQLTPADGGAAAVPALSLAEINQTLGRNYKDTATALAALKETQSFVGKKIAAAEPAPDSALQSKVSSLETQVFYASNPQFKGHESVINAMGSNPAEVVGGDAFKTYFEKATIADEVTNSKSVVSSNARLSQVKTVSDEAVAISNARGTTNEDTALVFARAINQGNNQG